MINLRNLLFICVVGVSLSVYADYHIPMFQTGSSRIATIFWTDDTGNYIQWPTITLNGADKIYLNFDILDDVEDNIPWIQAKIEHVNKNWEPEPIVLSQFVTGFNIADVGFGTPSSNGLTTLYRHYSMPFPNDQVTPKISGNYIISVFDSNNPDSIIVKVPLLVTDNLADITASVSPVTDISYKGKEQQLDVNVDISRLSPLIMPGDFTLVTGQNFNPLMWRDTTFPTSLTPGHLFYNHTPTLIYPAGNNFRRMEIINNEVPMMNVDRIRWFDPFYHHFLRLDYPKGNDSYELDLNLNGKYVIREYNSDKPNLDADYCIVHFTLDGSELPPNSEIYIDSDFTGRLFNQDSRLNWNPKENIYYKTFMLKQGAYSYRYYSPDPSLKLEGDFYQTNNIYPIAFYYRNPGERFDRLGGILLLDGNS